MSGAGGGHLVRALGAVAAAGATADGAARWLEALQLALGDSAFAVAAPEIQVGPLADPERPWRVSQGVSRGSGAALPEGDPLAPERTRPALNADLERGCRQATGPCVAERVATPALDALGIGGGAWILPLLQPRRTASRAPEPGAALLLPAATGAALGREGLERLWLAANLGASLLAGAREAAGRREARASARRDLREVARLQRRLLPSTDVVIRGVEVAARLDTFGLAGGDYYDYMPLTHLVRPGFAEQDVFGAMVADVTGHGPAAAVEAAMFDALLRTYAGRPGEGPGPVLSHANRHFFTRQGRSHFITVFGVNFDPEDGLLRYTSAGHPPALLKRTRHRGRVDWLDEAGGIPIGVLPDAQYESATTPFDGGDLLILYTDGVIEAEGPAGEQFGMERLERLVAEGPSNAEDLLAEVRRAVKEHEAGIPPRDDRTVMVLRRRTG